MQDSSPPLIAHVIFRLGTGRLENGLVNLINTIPNDKYRHAIICMTGYTNFKDRIPVFLHLLAVFICGHA